MWLFGFTYWESAVHQHPRSSSVQRQLMLCLQWRYGKYEEAIEVAERFLQNFLSNQELLALHAKVCPNEAATRDSNEDQKWAKMQTQMLRAAASPEHFVKAVIASNRDAFHKLLAQEGADLDALKISNLQQGDWAEVILLVWRGDCKDVKVSTTFLLV